MWQVMARPRRLLAAALLSLLAAASPARACDPDLIDAPLAEAEEFLAMSLGAGDLDSARAALRRVARILADIEAQAISCNCPAAQAELAIATADARRAATADEPEALLPALDATIAGFQAVLLALDDDLCR
jgi:hypothetical protein